MVTEERFQFEVVPGFPYLPDSKKGVRGLLWKLLDLVSSKEMFVFAKGDKKLSSLDNCRARKAMELQHCCIFTRSFVHPLILLTCSTKSASGTLSNTPSVAKMITSPSSTLNSYRSAASGRSLSTSDAISDGGKLNWNGVLK